MKKQKQYVSEEMILKDIKKAERRILKLGRKVTSTNAEIDLLRMADDPSNVAAIDNLKDEVYSLLGKISRLNETRLVKLKNTLAAFRTGTLPGMEVNSVVLQSK